MHGVSPHRIGIRGDGTMLDRATSFVRIRLNGDSTGTLGLDQVEARCSRSEPAVR